MNEQQNYSALPDENLTSVFDRDDYALPRWTIDRETGLFFNSVTGQKLDTLDAVIIKADKSRFNWPKPFTLDNKEPLCYSLDAVMPFDQSEKNRYGRRNQNGVLLCNGCSAAEWRNGDKPECAVSYNFLLRDMIDETLAVLSLSRARTSVAKKLVSFWRLNGVKKVLSFSTYLEQSNKGSFYQIVYSIAGNVPDWSEFAMQMYQQKTLRLTAPVTADDNEPPETEQAAPPPQQIDPETGEVVS